MEELKEELQKKRMEYLDDIKDYLKEYDEMKSRMINAEDNCHNYERILKEYVKKNNLEIKSDSYWHILRKETLWLD